VVVLPPAPLWAVVIAVGILMRRMHRGAENGRGAVVGVAATRGAAVTRQVDVVGLVVRGLARGGRGGGRVRGVIHIGYVRHGVVATDVYGSVLQLGEQVIQLLAGGLAGQLPGQSHRNAQNQVVRMVHHSHNFVVH